MNVELIFEGYFSTNRLIMSKILFFLIPLVFFSCATHAPMSEMVMFNAQLANNGKQVKGGIAVTYLGEEVPNEVFQKKQDGEYYERAVCRF